MAAERPVVFVGPEALPALATDWSVICADSCQLTAEPERILVLSDRERSSPSLLSSDQARHRLRSQAAAVVVWKSSVKVERLAAELGVELANSQAALARRLENKAHFSRAASQAGLPIPDFQAGAAGPKLADAAGRLGLPVVFQLAHGFSGARTHRAATTAELAELNARFEGQPCRISQLVEGTPVTVTGIAHPDFLEMGPACLQLTGIPTLTPHPMGSCGNDFSSPLPHRQLVEATARRVGEWVRGQGHRGVFGVDLIVAPDGACWCIEVNSRLVASVPLFSLSARDRGSSSLLDLHLGCFGLSTAGPGRISCHWSQLILYRRDGPLLEDRPPTGRGTIDAEGNFRRAGDLPLQGPRPGEVGLVVRATAQPGGELARVILEGPLVDATGALLPHLRSLATGLRARMEVGASG